MAGSSDWKYGNELIMGKCCGIAFQIPPIYGEILDKNYTQLLYLLSV